MAGRIIVAARRSAPSHLAANVAVSAGFVGAGAAQGVMAANVAVSAGFVGSSTVLPPGDGSTLFTLTLENTSASLQSANFITPMMGLPFKKGDLAGDPKLETAGGTDIAYTKWNDTTWVGGTKKFCGAFCRYPTSIAGSGSGSLVVKNAGSPQAASGFATTVLTASAISIELVGITGLTGTWTARLNDGITQGTDVTVIGDGAAGKVWRIGAEFRDTGLVAHGQLYCWFYVAALKDASGGLHSVRIMPRVLHGWADVASPAGGLRSYTAVLKAGATTLLTMQGYSPPDPGWTFGTTISSQFYSSWFAVDTDAKWMFVPQVNSGGSAAAECTVRVKRDSTAKAYLRATKLIPAPDLTVTANSTPTTNYYPYTKGPFLYWDMGTVGERKEIGVWTAFHAAHFLTQAAVDDRVMRVVGLMASGWRTNIRRKSTLQIIAIAYQGTNAATAYSGLGATQPTWRMGGSNFTGVTNPVVTSPTTLWRSDNLSAHRPAATYYPYLVTGEPQFLDLLQESAAQIMMSTLAGLGTFAPAPVTGSCFSVGSERNYTVAGTDYYGVTTIAGSNLERAAAWATRDVCEAAAISPDGTGAKSYFVDSVQTSFACVNAYNNSRAQSWRDGGLYFFGATVDDAAPWGQAYLDGSIAHGAMITENAEAQIFVNHRAKFYIGIHSRMDIAAAGCFHAAARDQSNLRKEDLDLWLFEIGNGSMTWSSSTDRFTIGSGGNGNMNFTPTVGDKIAFEAANLPASGIAAKQTLHVVQVVGQTFKLSLTPGGAAIDVTTDSSVLKMFAVIANFSPGTNFQNVGVGTTSYIYMARGATRLIEATGNTSIATTRAALDALCTAGGVSPADDAKWAFATSY